LKTSTHKTDSITMDEWLSELKRVQGSAGDEGVTVPELCAKFNACDKTVRHRLKALISSGKVVAGKAHRLSIDGVMRSVPVYRLKAV